jgi:hypothetical protein
MRVNGRELTQEDIKKELAAYGRVRAGWELRVAKDNLETKRLGMMLLAHEDGKLLLDILQDMFYKSDLLGDTPERTYFNLGRREVVRFLLDLRDAAKEK